MFSFFGCHSSAVILLGKQLLQSVQSHIGKGWRDYATLRSTFFCWEQLFIEHKSTFEPFLQHNFIHRDIVQQPVMAYVVEAAFDVSFKNPFRRMPSLTKGGKTMLHCIFCTAFLSESIGMRIGGCFRNGFKCEQIKSLHRPVLHRRNTEGA